MIRHQHKPHPLFIFSLILLIGIFWSYNCRSQSLQENTPWSIQYDGKEINNIDFLCEYIKIKSLSGSEKQAGEFLKSVCEQNGLYLNLLGDQEGNYNFAASLYPLEKDKPNIVLLNHIDVVPAGSPANWEYPPFQGHVADGEIWGRGALDMKGVAVAQLFSLLKFKSDNENHEFDFNITFLAVSAEEIISGNGASFVVENYFDLLNPAVVFCEGPNGMKGILKSDRGKEVFGISVADRKPLRIKLRFTQKTVAHGAASPEHYSAKDLTLALSRLLSAKRKLILNDTNIKMLKGLGELENGIVAIVMKYPRLFKPLIVSQSRRDPQMMIFFSNSITLVDYKTVSHSSNSLPQSIECRLDCRLLPEQDRDDFISLIKKTLRNPDIEVIISDSLPGTRASSTKNIFYSKFQEAIKKSFPSCGVVPAILPGYSDCIHFRSKEIPSYGSNPFLLDMELLSTMHNFNERIPIESLNAGTRIYYDFLLSLINTSF